MAGMHSNDDLMVFLVFLHLALANESDLPMNYYVFHMYAVKETREDMEQARNKKTAYLRGCM